MRDGSVPVIEGHPNIAPQFGWTAERVPRGERLGYYDPARDAVIVSFHALWKAALRKVSPKLAASALPRRLNAAKLLTITSEARYTIRVGSSRSPDRQTDLVALKLEALLAPDELSLIAKPAIPLAKTC